MASVSSSTSPRSKPYAIAQEDHHLNSTQEKLTKLVEGDIVNKEEIRDEIINEIHALPTTEKTVEVLSLLYKKIIEATENLSESGICSTSLDLPLLYGAIIKKFIHMDEITLAHEHISQLKNTEVAFHYNMLLLTQVIEILTEKELIADAKMVMELISTKYGTRYLHKAYHLLITYHTNLKQFDEALKMTALLENSMEDYALALKYIAEKLADDKQTDKAVHVADLIASGKKSWVGVDPYLPTRSQILQHIANKMFENEEPEKAQAVRERVKSLNQEHQANLDAISIDDINKNCHPQ